MPQQQHFPASGFLRRARRARTHAPDTSWPGYLLCTVRQYEYSSTGMHSTRVNGQYSHFCRPQNGTLRRFRFPPTCETHAHERKQRARAASDISDLAPFSAGLSLAPVAPERFHGGERRCETAATFATWHFLDGLRRVRRRYGETTATAGAAEREVQSVRLLTQTFSKTMCRFRFVFLSR